MMRQQAGRIDRGVHVGQHVADAAEFGDRLIELPARSRIARGRLEGGAGDADGLCRDPDAPALEIRQGDGQPLAARAQQGIAAESGNSPG